MHDSSRANEILDKQTRFILPLSDSTCGYLFHGARNNNMMGCARVLVCGQTEFQNQALCYCLCDTRLWYICLHVTYSSTSSDHIARS